MQGFLKEPLHPKIEFVHQVAIVMLHLFQHLVINGL
jgi:hypothetical protein